MIRLLSVAIIAGLIIESNQQAGTQSTGARPECWTQWFDRDDPSGTGDWETLEHLRQENPGTICEDPMEIDVRTTSGMSMGSTGDTIYAANTTIGFVCRKEDQKDNTCNDYRVRFRCPPSFCGTEIHLTVPMLGPECWTQWFDRDDPTGTGDWETLEHLRQENPGTICKDPMAIDVRTTSGMSMGSTGDMIYAANTTVGFVCRKEDQKDNTCNDYRVRFGCPPSFCECWTQWFDRDDPTGTGDWETLENLRQENPGTICKDPMAIDVRTTSGMDIASTGDAIYAANTTVGFVCRKEDQKDNTCNDYRVRFGCPPSFCGTEIHLTVPMLGPECWTQWFDRDDPTGTGDWETLEHLRQENPGKICKDPMAIDVRTTSGMSMGSTGDTIYVATATVGFVCRKEDQKDNTCNDYRVRFGCPPSFCECWTQWFDRDDPTGTGDWETLENLRQENPGTICKDPIVIDVRTTSGTSMGSTGDTIYVANATVGFVCRKEDQKDNTCNDYRVRFRCPPSFCECWTQWFDRDDPTGTGDWETLENLRQENPGTICKDPMAIDVRTTSGMDIASTGDAIYAANATIGFVCRKEDQKDNTCNDYRVRFGCPPSFCGTEIHLTVPMLECWTQWFDRDDPSGSGDWETLLSLYIKNPGKICMLPLQIEVQTVTGVPVHAAGDTIYVANTFIGFICKNSHQNGHICRDYRVRFRCKPSFCASLPQPEEKCWTQWFDRDNPSGTGDWETLSNLQFENPNKICKNPMELQVTTTAGFPLATTGEVIYQNHPDVGFVCKNSDQPDKKCDDYSVRFRCPLSFCVCWTQWFDRDDPSGTGDWESLSSLQKQYPGMICNAPLKIEAVTTDTLTPATITGQTFYKYSPTEGFVCINTDQILFKCRDYKVRFGCLCPGTTIM